VPTHELTLALHRSDSTVLDHMIRDRVSSALSKTKKKKCYRKENPLQSLAVFIRIPSGIEAKFVILVIVLLQVQQDRSGLEDGKVIAVGIDQDGDAPVGVQLDEPRLLLSVLADIYFLGAVLLEISVK
jgi:hypothetical protein